MRNPFPAYQWYARDYLSSSAHATMTLEEQGAYRNLLDRAWIDDPPCSLPDDDLQLAQLSGAGARWPEMSAKLRQWFVSRRLRLWNVKQLENFRELTRLRAARSQAGILAGRKSAEIRAKVLNQTLTPEQPKSNPASSSASASSGEEKKTIIRALPGLGNGSDHKAVPLDPELKEALEKTSHLKLLLDPATAPWWQKLLSIYEPIAELYVFDELAKADLWLESHKDRAPRTLRGAEQFVSNWFKNAEGTARRLSAGIAAAKRNYATQAPSRR